MMRTTTTALLLALIATVAVTRPAVGQTAGAARAERSPLVGTYELVSSDERGYLFYDASGLVATVTQHNGRAPFAKSDPTTQEALAAVTTYGGHFGTFSVDDRAHVVTHRTQGSFDPNDTGVELRFRYQLSDGTLALTSTPPGGGTGITTTWKRLPDRTNFTPLERQFVGFKRLVSNEVKDETGRILPGPAGGIATGGTTANPGQSGYIIYSAAGIMAVHMMQPNRPKHAGAQPTADEARAIWRSYNSYFGPWTVDEKTSIVTHQRKGSFNPNTIEDVPRKFVFDGRRVTLMPPSTTPGRQGYLVWEALADTPGSR